MNVDAVEILRKVALFSELPDELLTDLAAKTTPRSLKNGEILFNEGDVGDALIFDRQR